MQRCLVFTLTLALLTAATSSLARAGDGEALYRAFDRLAGDVGEARALGARGRLDVVGVEGRDLGEMGAALRLDLAREEEEREKREGRNGIPHGSILLEMSHRARMARHRGCGLLEHGLRPPSRAASCPFA